MLAITHDPIVFSPGKAPIDPQLLLLPPPALPDFGPGTVAPVRAETDAGHEEPIGSPIGTSLRLLVAHPARSTLTIQ